MAGLYPYSGNDAAHFPFRWGQLEVLPDPAGA